MSTQITCIYRLLVALVVSCLLLAPTSGVFAANNAVPPPLGPPKPWDPIYDQLHVSSLTYGSKKGPVNKNDPNEIKGLEDAIQETVDSLNAKIKSDEDDSGVRAKVSWSFDHIYNPTMQATKYSHRPNEYYVNIRHRIDFHVYDMEKDTALGWVNIPSRHLSQLIDLQVFCNQWQTGSGTLKLLSHADQPYLSDPGGLEQVLNIFLLNYLTPYINSQLHQRLHNIQVGYVDSANLHQKCDALGYRSHPNDNDLNRITWSYHPPLIQTTSTINDQISVKLVSVKRLVAHDEYDDPLYDVVEVPDVEMYANYKHIYVSLPPMSEGDEVPVNAPTMVVPRSPNMESLVVIANVFPQGYGTPSLERSAYRVFSSNANFGSGMQSIIVYKSYWTTPETTEPVTRDPITVDDPGGPIIYSIIPGADKPVEHLVAGYELVFEVMLLDNKFE